MPYDVNRCGSTVSTGYISVDLTVHHTRLGYVGVSIRVRIRLNIEMIGGWIHDTCFTDTLREYHIQVFVVAAADGNDRRTLCDG